MEAIASIVFFETRLCPSSGESTEETIIDLTRELKLKINHCISDLSLNNKGGTMCGFLFHKHMKRDRLAVGQQGTLAPK